MFVSLSLVIAFWPRWAADTPALPPPRVDEPLNKAFPLPRADEPLINAYSSAQAAAFLDGVAVQWTRERKCMSCHTNMFYLAVRPRLEGDDHGWKEVRTFTETEMARWLQTGKPRGDAYVVVAAFALVMNDVGTTGRLSDSARAALDLMWKYQKPTGEWNWLKCDWPPMEHDDYYGAVLAALAVGYAPDHYRNTPAARQGMARLKQYLTQTPPPDRHHAAMLLWASSRLDGILSVQQRERMIADLKALQRRDGGWSLPALGSYTRRDGTVNDPDAPSDGYATGLVTLALLDASVPPDDPAIRKSREWMMTYQRRSGRWFTRSLNTDKAHYISNAGTALCAWCLQRLSR